MMNLQAYLATANLSQSEFADLVGVKQPTVHRWLHGSKPSWDAAAKIEVATGGEVPVAVWVGIHSSSSSLGPMKSASPENVDTAQPAFKGKSQKTAPQDRGAA